VTVASYVALDLASRVTAARRGLRAMFWLLGGAVSMGSGIWAMRFSCAWSASSSGDSTLARISRQT